MKDQTYEAIIELEKSLIKLKDDFNTQLIELQNDKHSFHNAMIDLTAKYPEHKELVQFIVLVNDKLETKQENYSDIVSNYINDIVTIKKSLISIIKLKNSLNVNDKSNEGNIIQKLLAGSKIFGDIKLTMMSVAAILFAILMFVNPNILVTILKTLASIF